MEYDDLGNKMIETTLRVLTDNQEFRNLAQSNKLKLITSWQRGEKTRFNKVADKGGFNLEVFCSKVSSEQSLEANLKAILEFVTDNRVFMNELAKDAEAEFCVDIGLFGLDRISSVSLKPEFLRVLYENKIEIVISAYP